jgi:hypothetical protein
VPPGDALRPQYHSPPPQYLDGVHHNNRMVLGLRGPHLVLGVVFLLPGAKGEMLMGVEAS